MRSMFPTFFEGHDKDDADSFEDIVERDTGGYATQILWTSTYNLVHVQLKYWSEV